MPDDNPFDFYKAFLGVDIAKSEQIAELIGRAIAALYKGMTTSGLTDLTARKIIYDAEKAMLTMILGTVKKEDTVD